MTKSLTEEQHPPAPERADKPAVWDLVIADMRERDDVGRQRYGTPLQAHNGRDPLVDAYQEGLDQVVYLRQAIEERRSPMSSAQRSVYLFRIACGLYNGDFDSPGIADPAQAELAAALVVEEALELAEAVSGRSMDDVRRAFADAMAGEGKARDLVGAVDGVADVLVTAYGAACVLGVYAKPALTEVMTANMAKAGGPRRADGKLLKPEGWTPPDIAGVIERQRRRR